MKKFILIQNGKDEPIGKYNTKAEASDTVEYIIEKNNVGLHSSDDLYLTVFDFKIEESEVEEINEVVANFDNARFYLNIKPNADFTFPKKISGSILADIRRLVRDVNPNHIKALIALNELFTIAEAWNKADNFVPDFGNTSQYKYFPWFVYNKGAAGFVSARTYNAASYTRADIGSRLCFKTAERAEQFGKQFEPLYNQVFLLGK